MKAILLIILAIILCGIACADGIPDPYKVGSHSHLLSCELKLLPAEKGRGASFVVTLKNLAGKKLRVRLHDEKFSGTFKVDGPAWEGFTLIDVRGPTGLARGMDPSEVILDVKGPRIWIVPLERLLKVDRFGRFEDLGAGTHESLAGLRLVCSMNNLAVLPSKGGYSTSNACQSTPAIVIPSVGEQGGADQPATAPESKPQDKEEPKVESEGRSQ